MVGVEPSAPLHTSQILYHWVILQAFITVLKPKNHPKVEPIKAKHKGSFSLVLFTHFKSIYSAFRKLLSRSQICMQIQCRLDGTDQARKSWPWLWAGGPYRKWLRWELKDMPQQNQMFGEQWKRRIWMWGLGPTTQRLSVCCVWFGIEWEKMKRNKWIVSDQLRKTFMRSWNRASPRVVEMVGRESEKGIRRRCE